MPRCARKKRRLAYVRLRSREFTLGGFKPSSTSTYTPKRIFDMDSAQGHKRFLQALELEESPGIWGFTVYCTYPTFASDNSNCISSTTSSDEVQAEEDEFYTRVCGRFKAYVEAGLRLGIEIPFGITIPLEIEFIRLPSATVAETRSHFRAKNGWPSGYETGPERTNEFNDMRHSNFVVIDKKTIETIFEAPDVLQTIPEGEDWYYYWQATRGEDVIVITVVDVCYDEACEGRVFATKVRNPVKGSDDCITYYGFMKTTLRYLQTTWNDIIHLEYRTIFHGKDVVYKG